MKLLPRVKSFKKNGGALTVPSRVSVYFDDTRARDCTAGFAPYFARYKNVACRLTDDKDGADASFTKVDSPHPEYCKISITGRIAVEYGDIAGARNAVSILYRLLAKKKLPECVIADYPDSAWRGVMLDVARGYIEIGVVRRRLFEIALSRFNILHLHLMDSNGYALESGALPDKSGGRYTKEEMRGIVAYAASLGIQIVPEIELPGHACFLLEKLPSLACKSDKPSSWAVCVSNDGLYEFADRLTGELAEIFDCEYIHVGADELTWYDTGWPSLAWDTCERCKELSRRNGYKAAADSRGYKVSADLFYYFVRRMHAILKKHNRRMMMWSDSVDISKPPDIPRDILIQFWRVAAPGRGPFDGCSFQRFLDEGFRVVNSDALETYADFYIRQEQLMSWSPKERPRHLPLEKDELLGYIVWSPYVKPAFNPAADGLIIGGEMPAFDVRGHFAYSLSPLISLFGDRLCNHDPLYAGDIDGLRLTRDILHADGFPADLFGLFGGLVLITADGEAAIPPFVKDKQTFFKTRGRIAGKAKTAAARRAIGRLLRERPEDAEYIRPYADCLDIMLAWDKP